jgi:hypothetical protein
VTRGEVPEGYGARSPDEQWIICSQARYQELCKQPHFRQLVALTRLLNSLRFVRGAVVRFRGEGTPEAIRQRVNFTFFAGALLFEGMALLRRMSQHFRDREGFQEHIAPLLRDRALETFASQRLKPLRNVSVFHALDEHLVGQLEEVGNDPIAFASHVGPAVGSSWYELTDLSAMKTAIGTLRETAVFQQAVERLTNDPSETSPCWIT